MTPGVGAPEIEHILQFFDWEHLPLELQGISRPFCELAKAAVRAWIARVG